MVRALFFSNKMEEKRVIDMEEESYRVATRTSMNSPLAFFHDNRNMSSSKKVPYSV
jgi:hypothetical protein